MLDCPVSGMHPTPDQTRVLCELRRRGHQVIDLEALARHRGSVFGAINQPSTPGTQTGADAGIVDTAYRQPTCEQMENDLALEWAALDPNRVCCL